MVWGWGYTSLAPRLYLTQGDRLTIRVVLRNGHVRVLSGR